MGTQTAFGDAVELKINRSLLNPDFDHYLLASRQCDMQEMKLPTSVLSRSPTNQQYSYQHVKAFSDAERLVLDLFVFDDNQDHLYSFLDSGSIIKTIYQPSSSSFVDAFEIAQINTAASAAALPPALIFASDEFAVVSDGIGSLCVYKTPNRTIDNQRWKKMFDYTLTKDTDSKHCLMHNTVNEPMQGGIGFVLLDCRCAPSRDAISVLLQVIEDREEEANQKADADKASPSFVSRLVWIDIALPADKQPNVSRHREVLYMARLELATFNKDSSELVTVGKGLPIFIYDSKLPVQEAATSKGNGQAVSTASNEKPLYAWSQDAEEITCVFAVDEPLTVDDVKFQLTSDSIDITVKGVTLLKGPLEGAVHLDASVWSILDGALQVTLFKCRGHFWRELVKGDTRGVYKADSNLVKSALASLERFTSDKPTTFAERPEALSLNAEQLEECDNASDETRLVCWLDGDLHRRSAITDASCTQLLFSTRLEAGGPRAFASRHEHDGVVWSLSEPSDVENNQRIIHTHTLNAFGYIQAGHSQKRTFSGCAPDANYATIIDANHHAFIYLQDVRVPLDCSLRNRRTSKLHSSVSEQLVLNTAKFGSTSSIIGFTAATNTLYLLTRSQIIACHVR